MACKKARGKRAKTRHSHHRKGSRVTISKLLQEIPVGSKVDIKINGSIHSGMPFRRYQGMTGTVVAKQGAAYFVAVSKLNKQMKILAGPAHLTVSRGTLVAVQGNPSGHKEDYGKVAA